ncbi:MAG: hypothetical protein V1766_10975 [Pseudomonadota bacterium]
MLLVTMASLLTVGLAVHADETATQDKQTRERIGTYDSRAVAVAYAGSALHNKSISTLMRDHEKVKAAEDQKRVAALEVEGAARQQLMHKQGFSTAPVDNILEQIKGRLPAIKEEAGVTDLVSKWDKASLAKYKDAELVDVTMALVDAFSPNDRQRKSAIEIQKHDPIPLEQAENIKN